MVGLIFGLLSFCVFCLIAGWVINGFNQLIDWCRGKANRYEDKEVDGADVFISQSSKSKSEMDPGFRKIRGRYIASYLIAKFLISALALFVRIMEMDDSKENRTNWDKLKDLD